MEVKDQEVRVFSHLLCQGVGHSSSYMKEYEKDIKFYMNGNPLLGIYNAVHVPTLNASEKSSSVPKT